jgi:hypothetical protein
MSRTGKVCHTKGPVAALFDGGLLLAPIYLDPPHPLSTAELSHALGIVNKFMPGRLARDRQFLSAKKIQQLLQTVKDVRAYGITADRDTTQLLKSLPS